ncbi:TetR/AcrR family transcriptional regulator [Massilia sp. CF038]|uniref:TetR/AcrR family transcriptional regulator n=1 Tax=Massilia sp. CF038 TaxID=1881045 RepID=UPI0009210CF4|nr:TetR family transcriptional regulator [Massilia sp. CF038]SHH22662.1 transcriptional regulator, TetR family [Massilia sp. CF038]
MARKPNTDQRRGEIVAALLATMAEHGYEKATIQLIARQAGLAPGLLHYHFKTKAEILLSLVQTLADQGRARFATLAAAAITPEQRLEAYIRARLGMGEGASSAAVAAWVVIGAEAVRQPDVRAIYQDVVAQECAQIECLLRDCLSANGKQENQARPLAAALLALMEGAFQLASAAPGVLPAGFAADTTLALVQRYLAAELPARPEQLHQTYRFPAPKPESP